MAKPRVFISSTFYDLRHIRATLEGFIERLGYEAVLSEKGKIAYDPDLPLDESCYREASRADIFVLIIGGRYGSPASEENVEVGPGFYARYESITKKEYEAAVARDIPAYVLIDKTVLTEFETFKKNRNRTDVEYAHVESVNVFRLVEDILGRSRNNPIHQFERHAEIEEWLREQWAGLFQEFISRRSEQKQLASLSERVGELGSLNSSLRRYLEAIISRVSSSEEEAEELIQSEQERLDAERRLREFFNMGVVSELVDLYDVDKETVKEIYTYADSIEDLANRVAVATAGQVNSEFAVEQWKKNPDVLERINRARLQLGEAPLEFKSKTTPRTTSRQGEKAQQDRSS